MMRATVLAAAIGGVLAFAPVGMAQTQPTTETVPPQYAGVQVQVPGVFVTPIANMPLKADVEINTTRTLPDGTSEMRKCVNHIARSSRGEIYNERRMLMPVTFQRESRLLSSHIYDPATRLSTYWEPTSNVARATTLSPQQMRERKPFTIPVPGTVDADLGESMMSGVSVHGLRRTRTLSAQDAGALKPIAIVDEYWYSEDMHLVMLEKHTDPRTGEQIVAVTNVQRAEPDARVFQVPQGYRVVDLTPDHAGMTPRTAGQP
jgi:hypothetical protein